MASVVDAHNSASLFVVLDAGAGARSRRCRLQQPNEVAFVFNVPIKPGKTDCRFVQTSVHV